MTNDGLHIRYFFSQITNIEIELRDYLINVSKGKAKTRHDNKSTYKEVWNAVYPEKAWGRGNTSQVVEWIVNISNYDIENGRPPLNALVVRADTEMPGKSWDDWKDEYNCEYDDVREAQSACWKYWC